jgi:hypothetical protein
VDIDTDKIDEAVLALLHLTLHDRFRAWKGFDWDALDGSVRARARRPIWLAGAALVDSETGGAGIGDGLCGLRLRRCDGAA